MRYAPQERFRALPPSREPGLLTISPLTGRAGLCLDGEADLTSQDELQKALATLPPGAAEIHFELAGLKFIDVAATRTLIARTLQPPHPRLILHHPPLSLQRLIHLLWPDTNAQFHLSLDNGSEEELAAAQARPAKPSLPSSTTDSGTAVSPPSVTRIDLANSPVPALPPRRRRASVHRLPRTAAWAVPDECLLSGHPAETVLVPSYRSMVRPVGPSC